jgi:hypothetical protein
MVRYSSKIPILLKFTAKSEHDELGRDVLHLLEE